ncbi:ABC transporter ATP-binding protein [Saccharomonospora sp. NPDC046836]|uniref:ABC transporter ATP-binding protein n=1 Tax=Saccharomonospora sp. NPDC046836 TaxID=3156921 RepID=UPI0033D22F2A
MRHLAGVGKRYGRAAPVLTSVDLDISPGQVVAVVGRNGGGKSTLLRIVAGLARPSCGTVSGRPSTGYVPDRFPGAQRFTALGYLVHMGRIGGLSSEDARRRGGAWLDRFSLAGGPDSQLRDLSKGNAQKVGLAQALLAEPRLLVLDEPFSGLDQNAHGVLAGVFAEQRARGASVVFSEHRAELAQEHATSAFRLADGRLAPLDVEADGGTARIVLSGADPVAWRAEQHVLRVVETADHVELTVSGTCCDAILLRALQRGCSVWQVERPTNVP